MEWRNIDTAPRDGRLVDLWFPDADGGYREPNCWFDELWLIMDDGMTCSAGESPSHWMPLPEAPHA